MWQWMKRWADWLRAEFQLRARGRRGGCSIAISYEELGQTCTGLPVPWSADSVVVEVVLALPAFACRKKDLFLQFPHCEPIPAESVRPDTSRRQRIVFRFRTPFWSQSGEVRWKSHRLVQVALPVLSAETFLKDLAISSASVAVRLGGQVVPARQFAPDDRSGLVASAVIHSPLGLAPLTALAPRVVFCNERTGRRHEAPITLTAEQRNAKETIVLAACPVRVRRPGKWTVAWRIGRRELAIQTVEAIAPRRFEESIRIADARFAADVKGCAIKVTCEPPPISSVERLGPCFLIASADPGAAGVCRLAIVPIVPGAPNAAPAIECKVLVSDVPAVFAPVLFAAADLVHVSGFELRLYGRILGTASLSLIPQAPLTSEGGFKPPPDFTWTAAAEEELLNRLGRLGGDCEGG